MTRTLSNTEQLIYSIDQLISENFASIMQFSGNISIEQISRAAEYLTRCHPLLQAHLNFNKGIPEYEIDNTSTIPIIIIKEAEASLWEIIATEINRPFNYTKSPLARLLFIPGDKYSNLILITHHAISDGTATSEFLIDLLETAEKIICNLPFKHQYFEMRPSVESLLEIPKNETSFLKLKSKENKSYEDQKIYHESLPELYFKKIIQYGKENKISLHPIFCAIFCATLSEFTPEKFDTIHCLSPVDLRPFFKAFVNNKEFGYFLSRLNTQIPNNKNTNLKTLAENFKNALLKDFESKKQFEMLSAIEYISEYIDASPDNLLELIKFQHPCVLISNLGVLSNKDNLIVEKIHFAFNCNTILNNPYSLALVISTVKNKIFMNFHYPKNTGLVHEKFMSRFIKNIEKLTDNIRS